MYRHRFLALALVLLLAACGDRSAPTGVASAFDLARVATDGPVSFDPASFDIAATPDGRLLVSRNNSVLEIRDGELHPITELPIPGAVNGLAARGAGNFFATAGGGDLAAGAGVWHVSRGGARLVGDIEAFETANDPDAFEGPQWKDQACEEDPFQGFSAGPQSNPYHVTTTRGGTALVGDAAGNTLLRVGTNGSVEWVAVFTPPVDDAGDFRFLKTAESDATIDCYVQPVPTSVAVGPDGAYYVGELTGAPGGPGWSRVWRIDAGAEQVVCPSHACEMVVDGMTSIIDVAFGPDGWLYLVEYDEASWLAVVTGAPTGGTVNRCDVIGSGSCEPVAEGLFLPSAIDFDKAGRLWLLEGNIIAPTVRQLPY